MSSRAAWVASRKFLRRRVQKQRTAREIAFDTEILGIDMRLHRAEAQEVIRRHWSAADALADKLQIRNRNGLELLALEEIRHALVKSRNR